MARTYKRDANGRFAGGGSGGGGRKGGSSSRSKPPAKPSGSSSGGRKRNKSHVTTTGTFLTRGRAKLAQAARTKAFSSKATVGRGAKEAYKAASGAARKAGKLAAKPVSKVVARGTGRKVRLKRAIGVIAKKVSDGNNFVSFMQSAKIPSKSTDWGSQRAQGKRLGGGMIRGSMASVPTGVKKYLDYSRAKGVTKKVWEEIKFLPDEHKKAAIGAIQRGWSVKRALDLAYRML